MSNDYNWGTHNEQMVQEGRQVLERTSASLARSNQIAIETEHIGTGVITDLAEQRESLLRTQQRLQNANDGLTKSNSVLRNMHKHVFYNKMLLILIIILELAILIGLVYLKFK